MRKFSKILMSEVLVFNLQGFHMFFQDTCWFIEMEVRVDYTSPHVRELSLAN